MSITRKQKTTEEYKRKLETLPPNTRRNKLRVVSKFQKFCKDYHNSTPENICKELLVLKKQNEEEYIDTLYEILQDWINHYSKTLNPNSLRTTFTNLRSYIYYFGIKTDSQDVNNLLSFPRVQKEEKYPLKHDELLRIIQDQERFPVRKALYLACSSSGMSNSSQYSPMHHGTCQVNQPKIVVTVPFMSYCCPSEPTSGPGKESLNNKPCLAVVVLLILWHNKF